MGVTTPCRPSEIRLTAAKTSPFLAAADYLPVWQADVALRSLQSTPPPALAQAGVAQSVANLPLDVVSPYKCANISGMTAFSRKPTPNSLHPNCLYVHE